MVLTITAENIQDYKNGHLCPKCGCPTNTFRHMYAKRWCPSCNYVLKEEGCQLPYQYYDHLDYDTNSEEDLEVLKDLLSLFYINSEGHLDWPYEPSIFPLRLFGLDTEAKLIKIYETLKGKQLWTSKQ